MESSLQLKHNILFLDMDGVVNSNFLIRNYLNALENSGLSHDECIKKYKAEFRCSRELIFPELAERITEICNQTNCDIVWSSSWRNLPEYQDIQNAKAMFYRRGLPGDKLISYTPRRLSSSSRAMNIANWISTHNTRSVKRYAILDDRDDANLTTKKCKFFQTNPEDGITEQIMKDVIAWLK